MPKQQQPIQSPQPPPVVIEKVQVLPPKKETGLGTLSDMGCSTRGAIVGGLVAVVVCLLAMLFTVTPEPTPTTWQPTPQPATTTWMQAGAWALAVAVALAFVALSIYGVARLAISIRRHAAEARAAEIQAARVDPADNGLMPGFVTRGGTFVNLNAAPAGRVDGLNGARVTMPVPETDDHRRAADRASLIQLAAGAGSLANRLVDLLTPPPTGADMPPWLDKADAPRETALLLEAAEADFRRLNLDGNRE